jgi:hypothetical protein
MGDILYEKGSLTKGNDPLTRESLFEEVAREHVSQDSAPSLQTLSPLFGNYKIDIKNIFDGRCPPYIDL